MNTTVNRIDELKQQLYVIDQLRKISRSLRKSFEMDCNYGDNERRSRRQYKLTGKAEILAADIGFKVYVQGDCRGCALYLVDETMGESNYTNGIALY